MVAIGKVQHRRLPVLIRWAKVLGWEQKPGRGDRPLGGPSLR
jgi:hypothetical protein